MAQRVVRHRRWRWSVSIAVISILAVVLAACSSSSAGQRAFDAAGGPGLSSEGGDTTGSVVKGTGTEGAVTAPGDPPRAVPIAGAPADAVVPSELLIVKTGTLALQVGALDSALSQATGKVTALGGYVSGSERSGDGNGAVARVTYRIPAARWDEAVAALSGLADKVVAEQTQSAEVTGQVLDLGARVTNLQATERSLQAIMDKAFKISDVLDVQNQLTAVRGQIEQLETQKKHLEEQAAYGTLGVTYGLQTVAVAQAQKGFDPAGEVDRATASLVQIGQSLAAGGIWFAILWLPILIVLGLFVAIGFVLVRRVQRSRPTGPTTPILPDAAT